MNIEILRAVQRGQMNEPVLQGYHIFSNGRKGTRRPDNFGAVFVFNDDTMQPGAYLGMHPHANVEIVTVMLGGVESHEDNLGYKQELSKGDVQLISAGTGIYHAGGNTSKSEMARHLQIWIAPEKTGTKPFVQLKKAAEKNTMNTWLPIISPDGSNDTMHIGQEVWLYQGVFGAGDVNYTLQSRSNGVMIYLLEGSIDIADGTSATEDTAFISDADNIELTIKDSSSLLLIETVL